jgi:hypothetical protein
MIPIQTPAETLLLPVWLTVLLLAATIPLGLVVGYVAYRGFRKVRHRPAQALAVGVILLTAVDAVLGFSLTLNEFEVLTQRGPLLRTAGKATALLLILYAIYAPPEAGATGEAGDD